MATVVYTPFIEKLVNGTLGTAITTASDVHCLLLKAGATINVDHDELADIGMATYEFSDASYARQTLTNVAVTHDTTNNRVEVNADPVTFSSLTGSPPAIAGVLVYYCAAGAGTKSLDTASAYPICYIDGTTGSVTFPYTASGNNLVINWNSEGIFQIPTA